MAGSVKVPRRDLFLPGGDEPRLLPLSPAIERLIRSAYLLTEEERRLAALEDKLRGAEWDRQQLVRSVNALQGGILAASRMRVPPQPTPPPPTCNWTVAVKGCGGLNLAGATVSISGGPSGTTNSLGGVTLTGASVGATATVSKTGFTSQTITVPSGCASSTVTLVAASGYVCVSGCADPWPTTLHLTDSFLGSATLTWTSGTTWVGSLTANLAACACSGCPAASGVQFTYTINLGGSPYVQIAWPIVHPSLCPSSSGTVATGISVTGPPGSSSCSPLSATWTMSTSGIFTGAGLTPYCCNVQTVTVTP